MLDEPYSIYIYVYIYICVYIPVLWFYLVLLLSWGGVCFSPKYTLTQPLRTESIVKLSLIQREASIIDSAQSFPEPWHMFVIHVGGVRSQRIGGDTKTYYTGLQEPTLQDSA